LAQKNKLIVYKKENNSSKEKLNLFINKRKNKHRRLKHMFFSSFLKEGKKMKITNSNNIYIDLNNMHISLGMLRGAQGRQSPSTVVHVHMKKTSVLVIIYEQEKVINPLHKNLSYEIKSILTIARWSRPLRFACAAAQWRAWRYFSATVSGTRLALGCAWPPFVQSRASE
jgi:hypothetical protein